MDKKIIDFVMRFRVFTLIVMLAITCVFGYGISKMGFYTEFMQLFPANHPYVQIHKKFMDYFGGANVATLVLEVKEGDIYNTATLQKMVRIQEAAELVPGVNPYQIFSLASPRVMDAAEIAGGFSMTRLMRDVPTNADEMFDLKAKVFTNEAYGAWVSTDLKALRLQATFIEGRIDYTALFNKFIEIREKEEDANHKIYLAGEPILYGWVYYYVKDMAIIFCVSMAILIALLFFFMGRQPIWWLPLISASMSAIWGLGFSGLMGYQFDPLIVVVPFLLTARAMSHGVQWLNRFSQELQRTRDVKKAAHTTGIQLFNPCIVGVVTDAVGILIVALIPIPILQHLSYLGFLWGMSVIATVSLFLPVFVSFLPINPDKVKEELHWNFLTRLMGGLARFSITTSGKWVIILFSAVMTIWGVICFRTVPIGDANPGSPVLWQDSDYNKSVEAINKRFLGMEQMYVQVHGNANARFHITMPETMRAMDGLKDYLIAKGNVAFGFSSADFVRSINSLLHGNDPKFDIIPGTMEEIFMLMAIYQMGAAPEDMDKYMTPNMSDANVRLFLRDHRGETLKSVIGGIKEWIATQPEAKIMGAQMDDPSKIIQVIDWEPAGGLGGILAAAIELIEAANDPLVIGILFFTFICCVVVYRSFFAGFIFVMSLILANFMSFVYMTYKQIGININTVPVVSLGVGLGVDYGLYIVSQIQELIHAGASWEKGIVDGVQSTGRAVFYQAVMMSSSVFFWWFSPLRFQAEMGLLLAILMSVNMLVGVLLLPALLHMFKPKFMTRGITVREYEGVKL